MSNLLSDLTYTRTDLVDDHGPWLWLKNETGVWEGPKEDFEKSHKNKIFPLCKKFDVVVQAGGAFGVYPRLLAERFKIVYTFEPDILNFNILCQNTQEDNIYKFNAALGAENKLISINRTTMTNVGMHTIRQDEQGVVPQFMIDQLNLNACDLIWLDIEGYEKNALAGAVATISKFSPVIVAERGTDNGLPDFLKQFGYSIKDQSVSDTIFTVQ
jgi:FkbM family methyltransferase